MTSTTQDRNYYRQLDNRDLREQAQRNPTAELAIVLAERLEKAERDAYRRDED